METEKTWKRIPLKPWHGVVWFLIVLVALFWGGGAVQLQFGLIGVAITEIGLAGLALLPLLLFDINMKEMLPIKRPKVRHVVGTILLWLGTFLFATLSTLVIGYFFPDSTTETVDVMGDLMTSLPGLLVFLIIAVMPAICEEMLHRGFVLSSMRSIKKDWLVVLIMGLIFGIFHMDPVRFLATGILGAAITYVMIKTRNFLLPVLLHFINNAVSVIASISSQSALEDISSEAVKSSLASGASLASYLIIGSFAPLLIFAATRLLTKKDDVGETVGEEKPKRAFLAPFLVSMGIGASMFASGLLILVFGVFSGSVNIMQNDLVVNDDTAPYVQSFTIEKEKVYVMSYNLNSEIGVVEMTIQDEQGNVIYQIEAGSVYGNDQLTLKEGTYTATFRFLISEYEEYAKENGYPFTDEIKSDLNLDGDLDANYSAQVSLILV